MKLTYTPGVVDPKFFYLIIALYEPFLSNSHHRDEYQYTITTDQHDYPIGFFQLNSHHKFCQIALIPEVAGQGLGIQIVKHGVKLADIGKKVGWTCERHNIPSLKTLKALHGGIWNLRSYNSRKKVEGSFTLGKPESKQYQANVQYCLDNEVAIKEYEEWQKEYKKRKDELRDLKEYLTNYKR